MHGISTVSVLSWAVMSCVLPASTLASRFLIWAGKTTASQAGRRKPLTGLTCKQFGGEWQSLFATPCIGSGGISVTKKVASVPINELLTIVVRGIFENLSSPEAFCNEGIPP